MIRIQEGQFHEAVMLYGASGGKSSPSEAVEEAAALYQGITGESELVTPDFARFCAVFRSQLPESLPLQSLWNRGDTEPSPGPNARTSYLRNVYTDRAYRAFSSAIGGMTASYSTGYAAACEEVYSGRSSYVILPIHTSGDGRLDTFHRMLSKYDLNITLACLVEPGEGDAVLYALVQKGITAWAGEVINLSVVLPEGVGIGALFMACEALGFRYHLVNITPLEYVSDSFGKHEINLHFDGKKGDVGTFALFLEASRIRYRVEGIYNILRG